MLQDPMGLQTGGGEYRRGDWHWTLGLPESGFAAAASVESSDGGEIFSPSHTSSGASSSSLTNNNGNQNSSRVAESNSLSSYLMDGNVRAMLKKVTVNEGELHRTIQSLGGGEKGLKELMGYIMSWVREQNNNAEQNLSHVEGLHYPSPVTSHFDHGLVDQLYQPCTKSRRVGERSDVCYSGAAPFVNEFHYQQQQQPQQQSFPPSGLFSYASGHNDLTRAMTATNTRAARKNRIARQRQLSLPRTASVPSAWSVASPPALSMGMFQPPSSSAVVPGAKVNNANMLTFLLQKELRRSDVGNLGRVILPKKEAEMHLPILALREGVLLQMEDFDSGYCWNIRYRFWPNNKSRMYLLENTGEFVKQHHLQEGDLLILYRNQQGNYVLRGKKRVLLESRGGAQMKFAHSLATGFPEASTTTTKTEEVLNERDYGVEGGVKEGSSYGVEAPGKETIKVEAVKAEPSVLVDDDDPFFKEDVMHNIGSSFGPGLLQPLERFPSLKLDFPLDEIMAGIPQDDSDTESSEVVPKSEPAG